MSKQKRLSRKKTMAKSKNIYGKQEDTPAFRFSVSDVVKEYNQKHRKKTTTEKFITGGIITASSAMIISLFVYFKPLSLQDLADLVNNTYCQVRISLCGNMTEGVKTAEQNLMEEVRKILLAQEPEEVAPPFLEHSTELGEISNFSGDPVFPPQEDSIYSCMLDTAMGPLLYYNQGDIRWKSYLYGGKDPISRYGCGPVCVAMIINSFSSTSVSPIEMADWATQNGCYAPQSGSYHSLIPKSLSAFGLQVESVTERTAENAADLLRSGHILVALMGRGSLTQNGHFIIIAQLRENGNVYIADPANYENCSKEWNLEQLMKELKRSYDSGGPLWAVSRGPVAE